MSSKVLVTGASGFIGSNIARHFSQQGFHVYGTYRNHLPENLLKFHNIELFYSDLTDFNYFPNKYDILVHCAGDTPAIVNSIPNSHFLIAENTNNIFKHARDAGATSIIFLSSISVYGNINDDTVTEQTAILATDNYGLAKYASEKNLEKIVNNNNINGLSLRMPGVVGLHSKYNFLSRILQKILTRHPIIAENPDGLFNNVIHVEDLSRFILAYCQRKQGKYELTNIASKDPLAIRAILDLLQQLVGHRCEVTFQPSVRKPFLIDTEKMKSLNFSPSSVYSSLIKFAEEHQKCIQKNCTLKNIETKLIEDGYAIVDFENTTVLFSMQDIIKQIYSCMPTQLHEQNIEENQHLAFVKLAKDKIVKSNLTKELLLQNVNLFTPIMGQDIDMQTNIHLRVSRPHLESDLVDWHRDTFNGNSYWEMNVWFPVFPLEAESGLMIIEKSHLLPSTNIHYVQDTNEFRSQVTKGSVANELGYLYALKTDDVITNRNQYSKKLLTPRFGQFIIFFGHAAHRAQNLSDKTRITIDLRLKKLFAPTNTKAGYYQPFVRSALTSCIDQITRLNEIKESVKV